MSEIASLRLGTRGSRLALAQAEAVKALLESRHDGLSVEIVPIKTSGDRGNRERLGAFVREIQEALLANQVDVALHCLKDLPTEPAPGLCLAAYLPREDARDTLITRGEDFAALKADAVVGTGSVRRTSQLAARRPDLTFRPLVGNVDTRLRKLMEGEYDAIVLAIAGLKRLGVLDRWDASEYAALTVRPLDPEDMLPAPGQAVLVLETRADDEETVEKVAALSDYPAEVCSVAERTFLSAFGGGCSVPVAAYAWPEEDGVALAGLVASPDGKTVLRGVRRGLANAPEEIGAGLANELGGRGAFEIVNDVVRARGEVAR